MSKDSILKDMLNEDPDAFINIAKEIGKQLAEKMVKIIEDVKMRINL